MIKLAMILFVGGALGHMFLRTLSNWLSLALTGKWHSYISSPRFNNRGEAVIEDKVIAFDDKQQKMVDTIVQERLARERAKFGDYEDLKKFKSDYEKSQETKTQDELIKQKKFEEAENTYKTKINEFSGVISKKDQEIQDLRISHALTNEVSKNNGYIEESLALLRTNATIDSNGTVKIKGKDTNGIDIEMPLSDGVKKFYEQRPHLMKSTHKSGGGTGSGNDRVGDGQGSVQTNDLNSLNTQLQEAQRRGDNKGMSDIRGKIKTAMAARGVSR